MFKFEIVTNDTRWNPETKKSEPLILEGETAGCIDDYLVKVILSDDDKVVPTKWLKIGDVVIQMNKIQYIRVKAVNS